MKIQTAPAAVLPADNRKPRRTRGRRGIALAALGIAFLTGSISAFGGDPRPGYPVTVAVRSQPASPGRRPIRATRVDAPGAELDRAARDARIVDQLYQELMRQTGPGWCSSATNLAAMGSGC
jgi:hypothetical protein